MKLCKCLRFSCVWLFESCLTNSAVTPDEPSTLLEALVCTLRLLYVASGQLSSLILRASCFAPRRPARELEPQSGKTKQKPVCATTSSSAACSKTATKRGARQFSTQGKKNLMSAAMHCYLAFRVWLRAANNKQHLWVGAKSQKKPCPARQKA